jgi:hypothetical protein
MQSSGGCGRLVAGAFATLISAAGCGVGGGTLSGAGGSGGTAGAPGGHAMIVGTAGAGAAVTTGAGGRMNCAAIRQPATKIVPDILILLDTSASMNYTACGAGCFGPSKWALSVDAVNSVVDATTTEVKWGLTFIGSGAANTCDPAVGAIVGMNDAIKPALAARTSGVLLAVAGNRPTRAAIDGAVTQLLADPSSTTRAILLITDGTPNCAQGGPDAQTQDGIPAEAAVVSARNSGVNTLVVGLSVIDALTDGVLGDMAVFGGYARAASPPYFPAASSAELVAAMEALVAATTDCTYTLPPPPTTDGTTTRSQIDVFVGDQQLRQDASTGWTYTDGAMTAIQFNGPSCDMVKAAGGGVDIVFPCILI